MTLVSKRLSAMAVTAALATSLLAGAAHGSDYHHPAVVTDEAERWVPTITETAGERLKPVAFTVAEAGDQMIVGGRFGTVEEGSRGAELTRHNVFAFDAATGAISDGFAPDVDDLVWSAVSDGTSVWIGGAFRTVDGQSRPTLAKLDLATGALDPSFQPPLKGGRVTDLELNDGQLVAAGTFRTQADVARPEHRQADRLHPQRGAGPAAQQRLRTGLQVRHQR